MHQEIKAKGKNDGVSPFDQLYFERINAGESIDDGESRKNKSKKVSKSTQQNLAGEVEMEDFDDPYADSRQKRKFREAPSRDNGEKVSGCLFGSIGLLFLAVSIFLIYHGTNSER